MPDSGHTELPKIVAIRSIPQEGYDGWWLKSQPNPVMRGFTKDIGWINGSDENAGLVDAIVKAVNSHADLVKALEDMEAACEELAEGRSQAAYDAMIAAGQAGALLRLDDARKAARATLARKDQTNG